MDHAEGMTLFAPGGGEPQSLLVVYDSSSDKRRADSSVEADIFDLPGY